MGLKDFKPSLQCCRDLRCRKDEQTDKERLKTTSVRLTDIATEEAVS